MTTTERGPSRSERLNPRNWSLSIKLLIVGLVPTLLALGLGALRISDQADVAAGLGRSNELLAVRDQVDAAATAMRAERDVTVRFVAANRTGDRAAVDAAAATTDAQLAKAVQALRSTADDDTGVSPRSLDGTEGALQDLRRDTTGTALPTEGVLNRYGDVIQQVDVVDRTILRQVATPDVAGLTDALTATNTAAEQLAVQHTVVAAAIAAGKVTESDLTTVNATESAYNSAYNSYRLALTPEQLQQFGTFGTDPANTARNQLQAGILQTAPGRALPTDPAAWDAAYTSVDDVLQKSTQAVGTQLKQDTTAAQEAASNQAGINSVILMLGLLLGIAIIVLLARSLLKSLRLLRSSALDVAERQLPEAVESLRTGESPNANVEPVPIDSRDEVGQVARAFDAVHGQAVRLAADQAALQANVNSMFVNLSRRSQALVERQLQLIEQLENNEQDPDQLSNLFQLDHLATRMRRNSENLLVLAGTELSKRNIAPVPVVDVLRAAVSEVEQYQRIVVQSPPTATVVGRAANDLVHLLAELLDNATNFSPPDSQVVLSSTRTADGSILVEIADRGVGMAEHELTDANERLSGPAQVDVSASRRMGLFVVGRLAARHGIGVRLGGSGAGGLTASVAVPAYLIPGAGGAGSTQSGVGALPPVPSQQGGNGAPLPVLPQQLTPNGHVVPTGSLADLVVGTDGTTIPPLETVDGAANGAGPAHRTNGSSALPSRRPGANLLTGSRTNGRSPGEMFVPSEPADDDEESGPEGWALAGPAPGAPSVVPEPAPEPSSGPDPATGWALAGPVVPEEELRAAHGYATAPDTAPDVRESAADARPSGRGSRTRGAAAAALGGAAAAMAARRRARSGEPLEAPGAGADESAHADDETTAARAAAASTQALPLRPRLPEPSPAPQSTEAPEIRIVGQRSDAPPLPRRVRRPIGPVASEVVPVVPTDMNDAPDAAEAPGAPDSGDASDASREGQGTPTTGATEAAATTSDAAATVAADTAEQAEARADTDSSRPATSTEGADRPTEATPGGALPRRRPGIGEALAAGLAGAAEPGRPADRAEETGEGSASGTRTSDERTATPAESAAARTAAAPDEPETDRAHADETSTGEPRVGATGAQDATDATEKAPEENAAEEQATSPGATAQGGTTAATRDAGAPRPASDASPALPVRPRPAPEAARPGSSVDGPGPSLLPRRIPGAGNFARPAEQPGSRESGTRQPIAETPVEQGTSAPAGAGQERPSPSRPAASQPPAQPSVARPPSALPPAPHQPAEPAARQAPGAPADARTTGGAASDQPRETPRPAAATGSQADGPTSGDPAAGGPASGGTTGTPNVGTAAAVAGAAAAAAAAARSDAAVSPDDRSADRPSGTRPAGAQPAAQTPTAQTPPARSPGDEAPAGQAPAGQAPATGPATADRPGSPAPAAAHAPTGPGAGQQQPGGGQQQPVVTHRGPQQTGPQQTGTGEQSGTGQQRTPATPPAPGGTGQPGGVAGAPRPARPVPPPYGRPSPRPVPPAPAAAEQADDGFSTPIFAEIASAWFRSNRPVPITWADEAPQDGAAAPTGLPFDADPLQSGPPPVTPARPPNGRPGTGTSPNGGNGFGDVFAPAGDTPAGPNGSGGTAQGPGGLPQRTPEGAPAGTGAQDEFASTADAGWQAAERNAETSAGEFTAAGLPKRRPRARLVPGSAAGSAVLASSTSEPAGDGGSRTAEAVRGRLASYQRGIRQGRENRLRRERELAEGRMARSTEPRPAGAGTQDEETR
ncbi:nitrate- and nitrite sensing domain-containing protein [Pseudonocardia sp. D17]|uniref:nitrate- and nitrite sensing domain-containing protein n=1 Tax=Pseudonocardia sp. D17 TaxID=882661 RepID=UPI0030CB54A3|nr:hypothetical protein PSD17_42900 [Pseudonocardia sp. D17]